MTVCYLVGVKWSIQEHKNKKTKKTKLGISKHGLLFLKLKLQLKALL